MNDSKYPKKLLIIGTIALIISGINPHDYFTWILEITPAVIAAIFLIATYKRFSFSNFTYTLIFIHCLVLMYGGHYTYALAPLGDLMSSIFGFTRNNYDKIGHFMQGFVPLLVIREYFIRKAIINSKKWFPWIIISIPLALSAFYEFIEWWISLLSGSAGDSFLGTQGYIWDTQSDMLLCLIGSIIALLLFSRLQDRYIKKQ